MAVQHTSDAVLPLFRLLLGGTSSYRIAASYIRSGLPAAAASFSSCNDAALLPGHTQKPTLKEKGLAIARDAAHRAQEKLQHMADKQSSAGEAPAHHVPGASATTWGARFLNPWLATANQEKGLWEVWQWQQQRKKLGVSLDGWLTGVPHPTATDFARAFPLTPVDWAALASPPADAIQALWVGHATVLVQMAGLTFITDPCFSERCSPVQWAGPKRVVPAAVNADDKELPHIDAVLLSHNHYDHLDEPSVRKLVKRFGERLTWYVPLGVKKWFASRGIHNVVELDWWQSVQHRDTQAVVTFVPAQHWSARGVLDRRNTLWGGWVVKTKGPDHTFYFAGDSGYCPVFKEIGERLGPMDLSAIPIGAYEPRWFMAPQHVDAREGLQIHRDVRSRRSLAIHCCTWSLTDEPLDEPPRVLAEALAESGSDTSEFVTLQHGERLVVREGCTLNTPRVLGLPAPRP